MFTRPLFLLVLLVELNALVDGDYLEYATSACLAALAAVAAHTISRPIFDSGRNGTELKAMFLILLLLYTGHVGNLGYHFYVNNLKQRVASATLEPIYQKPFELPVGVHLTVHFTEHVSSIFSYRSPPNIALIDPFRVLDPYQRSSSPFIDSEAPKGDNYFPVSDTSLSFDLYHWPYRTLQKKDDCLSPSSLSYYLRHSGSWGRKRELGVQWDVYNKMLKSITRGFETQLEASLSSNPHYQYLKNNVNEMYQQYSPEKMKEYGFVIETTLSKNKHEQKCYRSAAKEKKEKSDEPQ